MKAKLSTQLSLGFALIVFIFVALVSVVSSVLINVEFSAYMETQQRENSDQLASGIGMQYSEEDGWNVDYIHGMGMYALNDGYIIKVVDANGETVWDAENHDMEQCHQMMQEIYERMQTLKTQNGEFVTYRYELTSAGVVVGEAQITYYKPYYYNENAFRFVDSLNYILLIMGAICIIGAICAGFLFARKISRPIARVTETAGEIAKGDYSVRIEENKGAYELNELSRTVNHMAEQIERQETVKKQLISDVAHELRTPLANVSAQIEVIAEGIFEPTKERLQGIEDEIERLSALVAELGKLQEIESGNLQCTAFDLSEEVQNAMKSFEAELRNKNIRCSFQGDAANVYADKNKIRQVIVNLISNAVKYSRENGEIELSCRQNADRAVFSVKDYGIGISETEKEFIFERFYRTDKSRSRKTGGVGIGLTIVKAIVDAHGGTVEVESKEGAGSTFTVSLPAAGKEE